MNYTVRYFLKVFANHTNPGVLEAYMKNSDSEEIENYVSDPRTQLLLEALDEAHRMIEELEYGDDI